ncbi:Pc22g19580 [Penicillium rubens Wisconsin 54-1255]|uniref:Pc22g19580 protein n=1 Tax=Penicillium rubens (strain ATCC 28089 / DSM 1075 / NRRL 1951 / Wisconsin 54-1255) TaxID=500485 RepID=B6HW26_PENRW|nr:Pc22g19580 [Penicillium rubens Wisconsin 54-1255]
MATAIVDSVNPHSFGLSSEPSVFTPAADSKTDSSQTETNTPSSSLSSDAVKNCQPSKAEDEPQNSQLNKTNEAEPRLEDAKDDPWLLRHWNRATTVYEQRSLQERIQDVPARLFHEAMLHRLFHDRLEALEAAILGPQKLDPTNYNKSKVPDSEATTKCLSWQEYSVVYDVPDSKGEWKHVPEIDNSPQSVIETLIEEPQPFRGARSFTKKQSPGGVAGNKVNLDGKEASLPIFQIRLRSPVLLKVLNEVTDQLPHRGPHEHKVTFVRPLKLLTLFWKELLEHQKKLEQIHGDSTAESQVPSTAIGPLKETESPKALEHLRLLNGFMSDHLGRVFKLREDFEKGTARKVAFCDLWHLFRPGTTVRTPATKQIQLYRVIRVTGGRPLYSTSTFVEPPANHAGVKLKDQGYSPGNFIVECFYIDFDGAQYGPVNRTFQIRKYEGERDMTALPVYPLQCDPNHESIREAMVTRGENFAVLSNPQKTAHKQYHGLTLDKHPEQVESQVIIDFQLAFLEMSDNKPQIGLDNLVDHDIRETNLGHWYCTRCDLEGCCGNEWIAPDSVIDEKEEQEFKGLNGSLMDSTGYAEDLTRDQKALLPFKVYGFVLRSRKWATFDIESISDVQYTDGWQNLVINDSIKETVLAMVENHESIPSKSEGREGSLPSVDLIQGKGKGLIILLHGEPGVGKTSTAECVADHTKRPLFPVTCGDIGDNAEFVEKNLERNFQLAHKWGCVLLLDEADVFLKRRNDTDLPRNAIVSGRSGILFLTTNRVGQIDRAFKSRIHVSLYYPKLDKRTSIQIWKNNIGRIRKEFETQNPDFDIREKEIIRFAKEHFKDIKDKNLLNWNGRQIRNAFQTAVALATFDARKNKRPSYIILGKEQFTRVAAAAEEFDRYLLSLSQGKNDSQLAEEHRWRADNFQSQPMVVPMVPNTDPGRSAYAFGQPSRSSKGRGPERGVFKEPEPSDTDSDSSTSSDKEESSEPDRRHAESDESSEPESDLVSSEEDRKKKRKGKSTSKTKDGKKRSSHKRSK